MDADVRLLLEKGKTLFKNQSYKKAESIFRKIVAAGHDYADVYNLLGMIYHYDGNYSDAIDSFKKALRLNPHYTEALLNLTVLYNDLGDYKLSKQLLSKTKKEIKKTKDQIDPFIKGKLANKHSEIGDLYRGVGLLGQAVNEYQRALELAEGFQDIRNKMAVCLRELGHKKEALKEFKTIISDRPGYAEAVVQLGVTFYSLGQKKDAKKVWQKLAQKDPRNQMVKMYLKLTEGAPKLSRQKSR
ncbi:MAG: hypothetical protein A3G32_02880 [Deltaproteobacteria bacterium RIFCSPLOWO2_12_FULL_40_28]|nr:MAG: hypothetical protein A3C45_00260 [Deltaproteobacteria bacterium RIFCSPHIGHO2_02_FULL_40_28]OGQ20060.1 MAG: hypothetical protein A3E27_02925 [Deltaproteobacteria bacterium RIFCSPHIGHO2_12_FULL_40_32]OGQ40627.1 MAG: hypothetical protein A3I69_10350 [Deltaproteobacteria bacterium RIFCSPLOWO2_02_FULL_40_36]OGQ54296.1 MAG: hypothetical protein A3G32_02880 [Deltaproteobacteria bacterium RIFCSPLOWO2_12_FULL_40_28]